MVRRKPPPCRDMRLVAMDRPRPLPSVERELSPRTKRSVSSSAEIFSGYREIFFTTIRTPSSPASVDRYTLVPGMAYLQMLLIRLSSTRHSSRPSAMAAAPGSHSDSTGSSTCFSSLC